MGKHSIICDQFRSLLSTSGYGLTLLAYFENSGLLDSDDNLKTNCEMVETTEQLTELVTTARNDYHDGSARLSAVKQYPVYNLCTVLRHNRYHFIFQNLNLPSTILTPSSVATLPNSIATPPSSVTAAPLFKRIQETPDKSLDRTAGQHERVVKKFEQEAPKAAPILLVSLDDDNPAVGGVSANMDDSAQVDAAQVDAAPVEEAAVGDAGNVGRVADQSVESPSASVQTTPRPRRQSRPSLAPTSGKKALTITQVLRASGREDDFGRQLDQVLQSGIGREDYIDAVLTCYKQQMSASAADTAQLENRLIRRKCAKYLTNRGYVRKGTKIDQSTPTSSAAELSSNGTIIELGKPYELHLDGVRAERYAAKVLVQQFVPPKGGGRVVEALCSLTERGTYHPDAVIKNSIKSYCLKHLRVRSERGAKPIVPLSFLFELKDALVSSSPGKRSADSVPLDAANAGKTKRGRMSV